MSEPVYLDNAATTPVRPEVVEAMAPFLAEVFGNPSSAHGWGRRARAALDEARERCAGALGVGAGEIFFTRGGTESDNLAILGRAAAVRSRGERPVVAISTLEHPAVRDAAETVQRNGGECLRVGVGPDGALDEDALADALGRRPAVMSVMWVNNEVGTVMDVPGLSRLAAEAGVVLHTDAVQAVGKVPVDFGLPGLALGTVTGHKIYGPKGTGLLYVREGVEVAPLLFGGGQERRLRPGTEDLAGAVGLAESLALVVDERESEAPRLATLRDDLEARLRAGYPELRVHGAGGARAPHVSNVGFPGIDPAALIMALDLEGLAVSGGSACSSGSSRTSPVLAALHGAAADGVAPVRFSLGRGTDEAAILRAAEVTLEVVGRLSAMAVGH